VKSVLDDPAASPLDEKHKALFRFLDLVNTNSSAITGDDTARLRALGWTDEELYFAVTVCALFNFYNRWIDATGVHRMSEAAHEAGAKRSAVQGYVR
jgi:alkylhydroperoxidase family enzyme